MMYDSDYVGMLAGWTRGYCKSYNCKYSKNAIIKMADKNMNPIKEIGTQSPIINNDDKNTVKNEVNVAINNTIFLILKFLFSMKIIF